MTKPARSVMRRLIDLAAPIVGINILAVLMLAVDSALCGRLADKEHVLAALGFALQVVMLLMVAMLGLLVGTIALVARAYGAKNTSRVDHVLEQSTTLTACVGVTIAVAGAVFARPVLLALGASDDVAAIGVAYLRPLMIGTPFMYLGLLYAGVLRGVGNTRIPFACAIVANVINAVLNYGLVLGHFGLPALGVTGSAIGTVIAQILNVALIVVWLRRGAVPDVTVRFPRARIDRRLAIELFTVGWPAALDMLVLNAGFMSVIFMLSRFGQVVVAAHGLGLRVQALAFVPGLSIAQATAALVGQALGGGDVARARHVLRATVVLNSVVMCSLGLVIILAAYPIVHVFGVPDGAPIEGYSVAWMRLLGYTMLPGAIHNSIVGLLQGSGATRTSLRINLWTTLLQVPLAAVLAFGCGLDEVGVWLSFPLGFTAKAVLSTLAYRAERWAVAGVRVPKAA